MLEQTSDHIVAVEPVARDFSDLALITSRLSVRPAPLAHAPLSSHVQQEWIP